MGLAGGALLAVGGGLGAWFKAGYGALLGPTDVPIALSAKELAVVRAIVDAFFPAEGGFPAGVDLGVHQRVDEELWAASEGTRDPLKSGLSLIEHLPPVYGHLHRFTALTREARVEVYGAMLVSSSDAVRQVAFAFKQMTQLFYYGHEKVWPSIHYDGVFIQPARPPVSSAAYATLVKARRGA